MTSSSMRGAILAAPGRQRAARKPDPLRAHLSSPLSRNGYALMLNTAVSGLLGLAYWLLAAHRYTAADVGRASAAYSAMMLLSGITGHSVVGVLTRFLPRSGRHTARFVLRTYGLSAAATLMITAGFLLTAGHWGASYADLSGLVPGLLFAGSVTAWAVFTLQDSALTGLRGGGWVLAENTAFGAVKIVLLVALAAALPRTGIDLSWMIPVVILVPLVNALIFLRLAPRHASAAPDLPPPSPGEIRRFLAGDSAGNLFLLAATAVIPVVIAARVGPALNAYFYMALTIASTIDLFAINMGSALTVEGAFDPAALANCCRAALSRMAVILAPATAGLVFLAPWLLSWFGPGYAAHGAEPLELLGAATLPKAAVEVYLGALRAQNRTGLIALIQAARGAGTLGLVLIMADVAGISGASLAILASQTLVAVAVAPGLWRVLARARRRYPRRPVESELSA